MGVYLQPVKSFNVPHKFAKKIAKNGWKIVEKSVVVEHRLVREDFTFSDTKKLVFVEYLLIYVSYDRNVFTDG